MSSRGWLVTSCDIGTKYGMLWVLSHVMHISTAHCLLSEFPGIILYHQNVRFMFLLVYYLRKLLLPVLTLTGPLSFLFRSSLRFVPLPSLT